MRQLENYYEVLHVPNFSEIGVIKESYRKLIKIYHPDVNPEIDPSLIVALNNAYDVLKDTTKRELYDRKLREFLLNSDFISNEAFANDSGSTEQEIYVYKDDKQGESYRKLRKAEDYLNRTMLRVYKSPDRKYDQLNDLKDIRLIIQFVNSYGLQRDAYMHELVERELYIYTDEGKLVPTERFLNLYSKINI